MVGVVENSCISILKNYSHPFNFRLSTPMKTSKMQLFSDGTELVVATTRPETIMGDVAVAVNPNDPRYVAYHNKQVWHPFRQELIPIICDDSIDPSAGTGVVKITPAHSYEDYKIGQKHKLPIMRVLDEAGNIIDPIRNGDKIPRYIARKLIIDKLKELNLWRSDEPHQMLLPICSRSGDVIEYLLKPQWFLNCKEMTKKAITAVEQQELTIQPKHFEKHWFQWLDNSEEWCISRQLWCGHRIPVYWQTQGQGQGRCVAAYSMEEAMSKLGVDFELKQDDDILDTWFSAALLPFSSIGWPNKVYLRKYFNILYGVLPF